MNRYHKNHPDPEIRQKYAEWEKAHTSHRARSSGFDSHSEHETAIKAEKERRTSVAKLLQTIGGQVVKGSKFGNKVSAKQSRKQMRTMQRTGGQRGS